MDIMRIHAISISSKNNRKCDKYWHKYTGTSKHVQTIFIKSYGQNKLNQLFRSFYRKKEGKGKKSVREWDTICIYAETPYEPLDIAKFSTIKY